MPKITDPANPDYDFGAAFNYGVWEKDTIVDLVNVPWNNDYRDIVKFADAAALNAYIDNLETARERITKMSYVKPNQPVRINIPFNRAYRYNYLRARNSIQPVPGNDTQRDYYYFITDVRYITPNTTEIVLQLDVWQTFGFDAEFGNCYIERGHIGIANENQFRNYGRDFLTIPEGLDVGGEYQIIGRRNQAIMQYNLSDGGDLNSAQRYDILIVSTVDLLADPGTEADPKLVTSKGGNFFGMPSGANYYVFDGRYNAFQNYLDGMKNYPWVTQGIISVTVIPPITNYIPTFTYLDGLPTPAPTQVLTPRMRFMWRNWRDATEIVTNLPERYRNLKKFFTYPYMVVQLTTFTGTPVILKPEDWADDNGAAVERISPTPPNQRIAISPYKYNAVNVPDNDPMIPGTPVGPQLGDDHGEYLDVATQITNFPTFAIVNNMAIQYMAANAHSIAYQYQAADWAQSRALEGNRVGYDQASSGMNLANELTAIGQGADTKSVQISNDTALQKSVLNGASSVIGGAMGGAGGGGAGIAAGAAGGGLSAIAGLIGTGIQNNADQLQLAVRNTASGQSNRAQVNNQGFVRDTNKNLADWAAKGDYRTEIAGINAKVQDARLTQPSVSGQVGGEAMNIVNNNAMVSMRVKMIDIASITVVGEFWLRYGYAVRRFAQMPTSLMCMTKFTYWKLTETYIRSASMPESFKQVLRGIFEKGVTVWANPDDIGYIDIADNQPLEGIAL